MCGQEFQSLVATSDGAWYKQSCHMNAMAYVGSDTFLVGSAFNTPVLYSMTTAGISTTIGTLDGGEEKITCMKQKQLYVGQPITNSWSDGTSCVQLRLARHSGRHRKTSCYSRWCQ